MFSSDADVLRTRQTIADLIEVVRVHPDAIDRIGDGGISRLALQAMLRDNGRIPEAEAELHSALLFAAATPDDDFGAFVCATALLLTDRLQDGAGGDDLYWNWDAFRDHYRLADPPVRAALMNGFRTGERLGRVQLGSPPRGDDCLTRARRDVLAALRAQGMDALADAIEAEVSAEQAGRLWTGAAAGDLPWAARAGFRYLYERPASLRPEHPAAAPLIPWG